MILRSQPMTMQIFLLPYLLMAVSLHVMAGPPYPTPKTRDSYPEGYMTGMPEMYETPDMLGMPGMPDDMLGMPNTTDMTDMTDMPPGAMDAYCQMLLQSPGAVHPDQIPWYCLCTHCQGTQGPKGDRGDRGMPGPPGSPGRRGLTGFRGPPGFTGRPGIKGQKGDSGDKGDQGMQGLMGPKGGRGFKGEKGQPGVEGRPGDQGPKGDDGVCPDACEASQGPPGPPGLPGSAGPRGNPGPQGPMGPKGSKGDMGNMGPIGRPGSPGEKGNIGPKGDCNCTDGADGLNGDKGDKGDQGNPGPMGPQGAVGPQGQKGEMGMMGMMGYPGPCMPAIQSSFSAELTSSFPPPNAPVVFSHVLYNVQGHYDATLGIYFAPVNGTYMFTYHLTVYERILKVGIFLNFYPILKQTDARALGTTSHLVILHLSAGDAVWLQVKDENTNGMYASYETSSTFSGSLLYPDSCDTPLLRTFRDENYEEGNYSWGGSTTPPPTVTPERKPSA